MSDGLRLAISELDAFVESLATRIASFDKQAISEIKHFADGKLVDHIDHYFMDPTSFSALN